MKTKYILLFTTILFLINNAYSQNIRKGPYLIYPNSNTEMTVLWQLTSSTTSILSWGTTTNYGKIRAVHEYGTDHQFKHTITELMPNTKYYYKIDFGTASLTGSFRTAPEETQSSLKFLAYGDTRSHPEQTNNVTGRMLTEIINDPEYQTFSLHSADWVNTGLSENDWDTEFFSRTGECLNNLEFQSKIPIMGARGNHENRSSKKTDEFASVFNKYFPYNLPNGTGNGDNMYYSFDYGAVHIIVIDQYDGDPNESSLGAEQLEWLENDLANTNKLWKFIILHEPGWSASSTSKEHANNIDVQQNIQPLCVQYGVQVVFNGHNHYYSHALKDGVHHLTIGGGGAPLHTPSYMSGGVIVNAEATYHFAKIDINNMEATINIVRPDGTTVETINLFVQQDIESINSNIIVYPNPTTGVVNIILPDTTKGELSVTNIDGQSVIEKKINSNNIFIDLSHCAKGVYFINIKSDKQKFTKKIVLE